MNKQEGEETHLWICVPFVCGKGKNAHEDVRRDAGRSTSIDPLHTCVPTYTRRDMEGLKASTESNQYLWVLTPPPIDAAIRAVARQHGIRAA